MQSRPYSALLSKRAEKEILLSFDWYEQQQEGLGEKFTDSILICIKKIERSPEAFSIRYRNYREAIVNKFPYIIIYRVDKRRKLCKILSVFHTAQNPVKKYSPRQ